MAVYEISFDLAECNISRNNHVTWDVWLSKCCSQCDPL